MARFFSIRDFFLPGDNICAGCFFEQQKKILHSHEFWELSYVIEGNGEHYIDNQPPTKIGVGEFLLISPGIKHCIASPSQEKGKAIRVYNVLITQEYMEKHIERFTSLKEFEENPLKKLLNQNSPFILKLIDGSESIFNMISVIINEYKTCLQGRKEIIENEVNNLLIHISRLYETHLNGTQEKTNKTVLENLIKFINFNFSSKLSLELLAEYVHLSPEYLSRYFKKNTGENISVFIAKTRIKRAKYMLRNEDLPIREIAEYCGYSSISSFEKAFKKSTGITASQYRRQ